MDGRASLALAWPSSLWSSHGVLMSQTSKVILIVLGVLALLWLGFSIWFSGYDF